MAFDPDAYLAQKRASGTWKPLEPKKAANLGEYAKNIAYKSGAPGFLKGIIKKGSETTTVPLMRLLGKAGVPLVGNEAAAWMQERRETPTMPGQKAGELTADIGMMAAPTPLGKMSVAKNAPKMTKFLMGLAKATGIGAQGATQHQAQNYAQTGEVSPVEAGLETGITAATLGAGGAISPFLKKLGINSARRGLGIPAKALKGPNPLDIEYALQNRIIPLRGGATGTAENAGVMLDAATEQADDALARLGILYDAPAAAAEARRGISGRVGAGGQRSITSSQEEAALPWIEDYLATAEKTAKRHGFHDDPWSGILPADLGKDLRQTAQNNASYVAGKTPLGHDLASDEFARASNRQLDLSVEKAGDDAFKTYRKGDKGLADAYATARKETQKLTPIKKAAEDESLKARRLGMGIDLALAGFGTGAAFANPLSLIPTAAVIGGRNMLFSPGGGRAFYEMGRGAANPYARAAGREVIDLARGGIGGRDR